MASRKVSDFFSPKWVPEIRKTCVEASTGGWVKKEVSNVILITFSGSVNGNAFSAVDTKYGVCEIKANNDYFGSMENGVEWKDLRKSADVHGGALHQFLHIWASSTLQQEIKAVEAALRRGGTVLITGHSIGGAIATLATLAILEKQPKCTSLFCITFGFPLIGDEVLARAVRRQGWANQFCHVVSKYDIFARILFAPSTSVSEPLQTLLPYWTKTMQQIDMDDRSTDIAMKEPLPAKLDITKFFKTVLQHGCAVVNYTSAINMDPTNKLIAALKPALKLSPFRPFGHYVFYSDEGAVWVENYEAVLPILFYTFAAAAQDDDQDQSMKDSIIEHTKYYRLLPAVFKNMVKLEGLSNLVLSKQAAASSLANDIEIQLKALGLGIENPQARLALRAAGEVEKQINENVKAVHDELGKFNLPQGPLGRDGKRSDGGPMTELKIYREHYNGCGYYDAFKSQKKKMDFKANTKRLKLASFWDRVVEIVENHKLPDDFQRRKYWIKAGTEYRLLVEPLDIANYYRLGKNEDSGPYKSEKTSGRPRRYTMLEKWLQDSQVQNGEGREVFYPELSQNSCFWAYFEELLLYIKSTSIAHDVKAKCDEFVRMINLNDLCLKEVVKEGSSLEKWWNGLSAEERGGSPLACIFQGSTT